MKTQNIIEQFKQILIQQLQDLIEDVDYFKKDKSKVAIINNDLFFADLVSDILKQKPNFSILNNIEQQTTEKFDILIAPFSLQFFYKPEEYLQSLTTKLNDEGVILASGFNIIKADESIFQLKQYLLNNNLKAYLINMFSLGDNLDKKVFINKIITRDNINLSTNCIEFIKICAQKKQNIRVLID